MEMTAASVRLFSRLDLTMVWEVNELQSVVKKEPARCSYGYHLASADTLRPHSVRFRRLIPAMR